MAVNSNDKESGDGSNSENGSAKDPYESSDDIDADPTFVPEYDKYPAAPLTKESSDSQPTCEYLSCTSDVFAACSKCSSYLCWDHFDDYESYNNCSHHQTLNSTSELIDITLTNRQDDNISTDKTLTDLNNVEFTDMVLTDLTAVESSNNDGLCDTSIPTNNSKYQHCEYEKCIENVFSTCMQCQGFLCDSHFNKFIVDLDCSMHKSFSTEVPTEPDTATTKKRKDSVRKAAKRNRNYGLEYINSKKKRVESRSMKQPCGKTCRLKCTENISEESRLDLFKKYWNLGDINRQRDFINSHSEEIKPKYRYPCENCNTQKKMRDFNYAFYFEICSKRVRVCKKFFKSTLDINDRVINTVRIKRDNDGFVTADKRGKQRKRFQLTEETNDVRKFIDAIPRIESHYLRAQSTREYIEGNKSLSQLYEDYKKSCIEQSKKYVSLSTFSNIFHNDFNISFFVPKKDRCEICVSYENSSEEEKAIMQEVFEKHHKEKELSREEKKKDKEKANPLYVVACYDLQAVLPAPRGEVSVFYYISKLATYNLTVSELVSSLTTCFVWHEGQGHRGVTEIGSCIFKFLEKKSREVDSDDLEIVFYSDNCCGQQKNKMMIALYIFAINKLKIKTITHKFLIKGHTQNEGDAVHSTIEKKIRSALKCGPIYSPQEYVTLIKTAKKKPPFYTVEELSFDDFYDVKGLSEKAGYNFSKSTENESVKIADIKILQIRKNDPSAFYIKTSYEYNDASSFKRIELIKQTRNKTFSLPENLNKAYTKKMEVSEKKKQEIMKLIEKRHIPKAYFDFYNSL